MTISTAGTARNMIPHSHQWLYRALRGHGIGISVLDYGSGPYQTGSEFLRMNLPRGSEVFCYDPENRTPEENEASLSESYRRRGVDVVVMSNVLNVIEDAQARRRAIKHAFRNVAVGGALVVTVYEGDRSGKGGPTRDGWQAHRTLTSYVEEIVGALTDAGFEFTYGRSGRVLVFERGRLGLLKKFPK